MQVRAFLATVATRWEELDSAKYPFLNRVTARLRDHDDREQFLAGINLTLAGIDTVR
ncbi:MULTISPECIES: hypothetical protein [unclassified Rhodococcus (in: high G+C Gram-positive bacteria)]|uniref:hypothetical protein n=1 Tax=unclassified Rhodococcus (in: high G+C Gram-positive bacteria) TaxID=192944 RepID=UPI0029536A92|nr:hypothetical protein [Rhodococcus sp. IEGM 1318]MDV8003727.1 hypothetical protein [Rhodococcus sp. IEGM 1318]MDZ7912057.1 hypothetical protein [Rhodococcus sp. (in: high G+C Gram-positive bacteria)]